MHSETIGTHARRLERVLPEIRAPTIGEQRVLRAIEGREGQLLAFLVRDGARGRDRHKGRRRGVCVQRRRRAGRGRAARDRRRVDIHRGAARGRRRRRCAFRG